MEAQIKLLLLIEDAWTLTLISSTSIPQNAGVKMSKENIPVNSSLRMLAHASGVLAASAAKKEGANLGQEGMHYKQRSSGVGTAVSLQATPDAY